MRSSLEAFRVVQLRRIQPTFFDGRRVVKERLVCGVSRLDACVAHLAEVRFRRGGSPVPRVHGLFEVLPRERETRTCPSQAVCAEPGVRGPGAPRVEELRQDGFVIVELREYE